jgi:hypothetical protein
VEGSDWDPSTAVRRCVPRRWLAGRGSSGSWQPTNPFRTLQDVVTVVDEHHGNQLFDELLRKGLVSMESLLRDLTLLRRGDLSVTEVCFAVGCSSLGTFSTR